MRLTTALVVGAVIGTLLGQTGYSLYQHSFFSHGVVYRRWAERSSRRRT